MYVLPPTFNPSFITTGPVKVAFELKLVNTFVTYSVVATRVEFSATFRVTVLSSLSTVKLVYM